MIKAIIITHGDLGRSLLNTTQKIIGEQQGIKVISNEHISMKDLVENLHAAVKDWDKEKLIFFIDFLGGSCWHAARVVKKDKEDITLISGVNLPMLLAYINHRDRYQLHDLADYLKETSDKATIVLKDDE